MRGPPGARASRLLVSRWFPWVYWSALAAAWGAVSYLVVPSLIRLVHATRIPLPFGLLEGRRGIPPAEYLADWAARIPALTFAGLTLALLVFIALLLVRAARLGPRHRPARGSDGPAQAGGDRPSDPGAGWPGPRGLSLLSAWFGLVAGVGEAYYLGGRAFLLDLVVPGFRVIGPDSLWMAPLVDVVLFLLVGLLLIVPGRFLAPARRFRVVVTGLLFLVLFGWASVTGRLATVAAILLAAGLALHVGRFATRHASALAPLVRRSAAVLIAIVGGTALAVSMAARPADPPEPATFASGPAGEPPNLLLVVLDTQRAASTGLYDPGLRTTPGLERWARAGAVFERAIAPSPWTLPSHAELFTGRPNHELGTDYFVPLAEEHVTLAEVLRAHGYATGGFVANIDFGSPFYGLDQGFERYEAQPRTPGMAIASSWLARGATGVVRKALGDHRRLVRKRGSEVNRAFFDWREGADGRPFFAFLNYFDPHAPYRPPEPHAGPAARGWRYWLEPGEEGERASSYTEAELRELRAAYEAAIAYTDLQVGRLLDGLADRGLLERTVVIVTSDHGEEFGEHGRVGHGSDLFLTQLHVPLVLLGPGVPRGARITAPVGLRDLPATALDLLGLDPMLPGRSLRPLIEDSPAGRARPPDPVLSERASGSEWSVVAGSYHYLRGPAGEEALYDIESDPDERRDLSGAAALAPLLARLRAEIPARSAPRAASR